METIKMPFTVQQYNDLREEQKAAVHAVAEFLPDGLTSAALESDERLSETFNLLKPCRGCIPVEEIEEDAFQAIRRKFRAIYQAGIDLAGQALAGQGLRPFDDFSFTLVIDARRDDASDIAIVDYRRPACYLYETPKIWEFHFGTLAALSSAVLKVKDQLVSRVLAMVPAKQPKRKIYVRVQEGMVQDVSQLPPDIEVVVLDYDVEHVPNGEGLQLSPLDGGLCIVSTF